MSDPDIEAQTHERSLDKQSLSTLVKERDLKAFSRYGGAEGIAAYFGFDIVAGINGEPEDLSRRLQFGSNTYPTPPSKCFLNLVLEEIKDNIILILCAVLSLTFGIEKKGLKEGWYDGGSIFIAVFLVVVVGAVSNFQQARQFDDKLSKESNIIHVIRNGQRQSISESEVLVGEVVCLKVGDQIPADGLFLAGHSFQVAESRMTCESDLVNVDMSRPFLISGAMVTDGYGKMLVTSVGLNTTRGEKMSSITHNTEENNKLPTPLQARLNKLTSYVRKIGLPFRAMVFVVLFARYYFARATKDDSGNREFVSEVVNAVARVRIDFVVAIPKELPLAVTLILAHSVTRMMVDKAIVRVISACETMGSTTTICTDKTGTLTTNQMKVTRFWLGEEMDIAVSQIASNVLEFFHQGVALNTTGSVYRPAATSEPEFSGSPTEKAILSWAVLDLGMNMEMMKQNYTILHAEAFNSESKRSGVVLRKSSDQSVCMQWKGAAEMILSMCRRYVDSHGELKEMDSKKKIVFDQIIQGMAAHGLRCIAFAHRQLTEDEVHEVNFQNLPQDGFSLLGLVGLIDPCRPGVKEAIEACKNAGVVVKMITGDNVFTAKAIALECGILSPNDDFAGAVVEGKDFRNYTVRERMERVAQIRVMARSSPLDKLLMVQCLKKRGEVVAVIGDGTDDAPALKEADVGLSMGIGAKESSDIVILDDNFLTVVTVISWGRCVYKYIQKFIQFQLTVNVTALTINFVSAISSGDVPITTLQLLWVNLIMGTLEEPTKELMKKKPVGRTEPLITNGMWRNLLAQAVYQIAVLLFLQFKGEAIFGVDEKVKKTLIFNTFVLCQVFNELNARRLQKNVFEGIFKNKLFGGIVGITGVLQVLMVEFLKKFADTERMDWGQWGICIAMGALSWPLGWLVKCIPVSDKPLFGFVKV